MASRCPHLIETLYSLWMYGKPLPSFVLFNLYDIVFCLNVRQDIVFSLNVWQAVAIVCFIQSVWHCILFECMASRCHRLFYSIIVFSLNVWQAVAIVCFIQSVWHCILFECMASRCHRLFYSIYRDIVFSLNVWQAVASRCHRLFYSIYMTLYSLWSMASRCHRLFYSICMTLYSLWMYGKPLPSFVLFNLYDIVFSLNVWQAVAIVCLFNLYDIVFSLNVWQDVAIVCFIPVSHLSLLSFAGLYLLLVYNRDGNGQGPFQLKVSGSRSRLGPSGVQGQGPSGGLKGATPPLLWGNEFCTSWSQNLTSPGKKSAKLSDNLMKLCFNYVQTYCRERKQCLFDKPFSSYVAKEKCW